MQKEHIIICCRAFFRLQENAVLDEDNDVPWDFDLLSASNIHNHIKSPNKDLTSNVNLMEGSNWSLTSPIAVQ